MHELLEKTLREASAYFQNFLIHGYSKKGVLHSIDARVKLLATLIFVVLAVATFNIVKIGVVLIALLLIARMAEVRYRELFSRIWLFTLFAFIVVVPASVHDPAYGFIFTARVATSLIALQLLILTTPFSEICYALRWFRVPEIFVSALWLAYRYVLLMFSELMTILMARESRRVAKGSHLEVWRKGGEAVGLFFIRSFEKAEKVQMAMMSRGDKMWMYRRKLAKNDVIFALIAVFVVVWWVII